MLSLAEKLMLIALHDENGSIISSSTTALPYAIAGTLIVELHLKGKITLTNGKVEVVDKTPAGDELLDKALELIMNSKKQRDVQYWVCQIVRKIEKLNLTVIESLIRKEILRKENHKILWVIPTKRYPIVNVAPEYEIRGRIHQILIQKDTPNEEEIALLSLIKACDLLNVLFPKTERKMAKARLKKLIENEVVGKAVSSVVEEILIAVTVVIAASVLASTTNTK
ncbi:MAG: GPP34 family phosphoprotein [Calditrichaeota bacterium]|nr:MAG: GPP34 family phosphoprotein [Calditrichota bacterium]